LYNTGGVLLNNIEKKSMKTCLTTVLIFLAIGLKCNAQSTSVVTASEFDKLRWLEGSWDRTGMQPGKTAHERWFISSDGKYNGYGVSMNGRDTSFLEKLAIEIKDGKIYYVADVPENKGVVYFLFTELSETGFVCENAEHDFPKKISYSLSGKELKAQISGKDQKIDFLFYKRE